jgi:hypothetical protein
MWQRGKWQAAAAAADKPITNTQFETLSGFKNKKAAVCSTSARVLSTLSPVPLPSLHCI